MSQYVELHCLSNFTFLRGASHPEELVAQAHGLGYSALAITDECSLAGVVRAHVAAREAGLKLLIGSEFQLADGPKLVLLAMDRDGYGNLSQLITLGRRRAGKGSYYVTKKDVEEFAGGCLGIWLPGSDLIPSPSATVPDVALPPPSLESQPSPRWGEGEWIKKVFPNRAWIGVELLLHGNDQSRLQQSRVLSEQAGLPLVACGDVHMHVRGRRPVQDVLTAIRLKTPVHEAGFALFPNGERHLRRISALRRIYPKALLVETLQVTECCQFSLDELRYEYPEELVPSNKTPGNYLRELTEQGMEKRWPDGVSPKVQRLVEHELALIAELHYEPYFLTVYDIVRFARSRNILCQGRGSAANSAVCFCLGITEVDPARIEMLFERFISKERNEPPDIDVDFEHERREEVIQYLYNKYGRDRAALTATVITYRPKSAVRDVGKALGLSLDQVGILAKTMHWWDGKQVMPERLREAGFDPDNPIIVRLTVLVNILVGFPRHLSQHVGGFVITRGLLSRLVPIENAAMTAGSRGQEGKGVRPLFSPAFGEAGEKQGFEPFPLDVPRTVIQWDKDDLDALGLLKVDCLGLGMLTAIHRALDLVNRVRGTSTTLASIPAEDPKVYAMIQRADTIGVFQIESRAQMAMLPRLKPACFYDLVIEVAIVRPGPIQGDMVHPYLRRRQGIEAVDYPSDAVREVLERTLGVPIFQEQVIKVAIVAAGFSPGEADQLRRSMGAWRRRGGLEHFEQRLIAGMQARGYAKKFAQRIFRQILGFGEYGFPESHAAGFALLVYVSAWLKCHEPAAFSCALLNSQPMGFYAPAQLIQDTRRHGVEVRPVDVSVSDWDCGLENRSARGRISSLDPYQPALRLGLRMVKGLSEQGAQRLVAARKHKAFVSVEDLAHRAALDRKDMEALAAANALAGLAGNRHQARWACAGIELPLPVLEHAGINEALPLLRRPTEGEDIVADYAGVGLTLGRHPLALLRERLQNMALLSTAQVRARQHGEKIRTAGLVIGRQRPGTASGVIFVTLEDETGNLNIIVWRQLGEQQRRELLGARLLGVVGEVQREGEVLHVIAKDLQDYSTLLGGLMTHSRDFH
ncbi:MAG: error-prone DNA polymerase [Gammaproteobacteria bacterium]